MLATVRAASLEVTQMGGHEKHRCADRDPTLADLAERARGCRDRERDPQKADDAQSEDPTVFVPPAA